METYEKILTDQDFPETFSEYLALCLDDNDMVIYGCRLGNEKAFRISVREVVAFHVYEELCHPDMDKSRNDPRPPYSNESGSIYYPVLEVIYSNWIDSFSENRLRDHQREGARHFQFLSYSNVIDVISYHLPKALVVPFSEYEETKRFISEKFT